MNNKEIAAKFTNKKLKAVDTLVGKDYTLGYQEGIEHFLDSITEKNKNKACLLCFLKNCCE